MIDWGRWEFVAHGVRIDLDLYFADPVGVRNAVVSRWLTLSERNGNGS